MDAPSRRYQSRHMPHLPGFEDALVSVGPLSARCDLRLPISLIVDMVHETLAGLTKRDVTTERSIGIE